MATDLKERPSGVYDPEDTGLNTGSSWRPEGFDEPDFDGVKNGSKVNKDITNQEANPTTADGQSSAVNQAEQKVSTDDKIPKGYTGGQKKKLGLLGKVRHRRKQLIAGSVATGVVTAVVMFVLAAPVLIIGQVRDYIVGRVHEVSISDQRRYRRSRIARVSDMFSRDGRVGGRLIADMQSRGYRFSFDDPLDRNRVTSIQSPGSRVDIVDPAEIGREVDRYMDAKRPFPFGRWKTKNSLALYRRFGIETRLSPATNTPDRTTDPEAEVNRRFAGTSLDGADGNNPVGGRIDVESDDLVDPGPDAPQEEIDAYNRQRAIADSVGESSEVLQEARTSLVTDGTPVSQLNPDVSSLLDDNGTATNPGLRGMLRRLLGEGGGSFGGRALGGLVSTIDPTDFLAKLCTVRNVIRAGITASRTTSALALMRQSLAVVAVADDVRMGRASSELFGEFMKRLTLPDAGGNYIGSGMGMSLINNGYFSRSRNDLLRSDYDVAGRPSGLARGYLNAIQIPGCGIWSNPLTSIAATAGTLVISALTFGGAGAAAGGASAAANAGFRAALVNTIRGITARQVIFGLAIDGAIDLTFNEATTYIQLQVEKQMALPVTGQARGQKGIDQYFAGGGVAAKQRGLQAGQVPATDTQYGQALTAFENEKRNEMESRSFASRVFDYSNMDSLAFNLVGSMAFASVNISNTSSNIMKSVASTPTGLLNTIGSTFMPKAFAQETDEDKVKFETITLEGDGGREHEGEVLATDFAGNLLTIMPDWLEEADAEANRDTLIELNHIDATTYEPISPEFIGHMEKCVYSVDTISVLEARPQDSEDPTDDCLATLSLTRQFKIHLAYLDFIDTMEAEFIPEEINEGQLNTGTPITNQLPSDSGIIGDPFSDSTEVPCATGTVDLGIYDSYTEGVRTESRLCGVREISGLGIADYVIENPETAPREAFLNREENERNGVNGSAGMIVVNSRVSGAVRAMALAAQADGVTLAAGYSFRTHTLQRAICYTNAGCSDEEGTDAVARPGYSLHQSGNAIDFLITGDALDRSCSNRSRPTVPSPMWDWLLVNAERFGYRQLSTEPWHWDPRQDGCTSANP